MFGATGEPQRFSSLLNQSFVHGNTDQTEITARIIDSMNKYSKPVFGGCEGRFLDSIRNISALNEWGETSFAYPPPPCSGTPRACAT